MAKWETRSPTAPTSKGCSFFFFFSGFFSGWSSKMKRAKKLVEAFFICSFVAFLRFSTFLCDQFWEEKITVIFEATIEVALQVDG